MTVQLAEVKNQSVENLEGLKALLGDYAKDTRLNLSSVLRESPESGLDLRQIGGIALSSAYATKNTVLINALQGEFADVLEAQDIEGAKAATTIMGMNNVYYRFLHMVSDKDYGKMPAGLRMNVIANPGIEKIDFELYSLAVSAINGCGMCVDSHVAQVEKAGLSKAGVQHCIRIAAVINAAAQALLIGNLNH